MEVIPRLGADEGHQIGGIAEFAHAAVAAGQVTAQCHQPTHAHGLEQRQLLAHRIARRTDAGEMRSPLLPLVQNGLHGLQGAVLGRAPRAVGHRAELGLLGVELLAHGAQLLDALGRLGREKFETDRHGGRRGVGCVHADLLA